MTELACSYLTPEHDRRSMLRNHASLLHRSSAYAFVKTTNLLVLQDTYRGIL
jgi:hypothetical protein